MRVLDWAELPAWLSERDRQGLRRSLRCRAAAGGRVEQGGRPWLNFSSNDYLDLARDPRVVEGAAEAAGKWGAGSGASRLMSGTLPCHEALEEALARLKGYPAALVYGSGYSANLGLLDALLAPGDPVVADRLAHASLLDGARLAGAKLRRFRHNDPEQLARCLSDVPGPALVVTEAVFSMDGDQAPLPELVRVCESYGAELLVDEAHATGVLGPGGAGAVRASGCEGRVRWCMGTLSKALGSFGGFVACSTGMRDYLVNTSRSFIYSTALPPPCAGAALAALRVLEEEPDRPLRLAERSRVFRARLREAGIPVDEASTPIIPVQVGSSSDALRLSAVLEEQGIWAVSVRPPTVPRGTARLRFSVTLAHTDEDFAQAAVALSSARKSLS